MLAKFALVSLLFLFTHGLRCEKSSDCESILPCSFDFCEPLTKSCIFLSREPSCNTSRREIDRARLEEFMNRDPISLTNRLTIIRRISRVLLGFHPHRLLHLRFLNVDPVRLFSELGNELRSGLNLSNIQFHNRIFDIIQRLNDLHTVYISPSPLGDSRAFIPFTFKEYYTEGGERKFVVTDVGLDAEFSDKSFGVGSEIVTWDGEDIEDAILREGEVGYGSNPAAQFANGIFNLRVKFLVVDPLPIRDFVEVGFKNTFGNMTTIRVDWIYSTTVSNASLPFFLEDPNFPTDALIVSRSQRENEQETAGDNKEEDIRFSAKQMMTLEETSRLIPDRLPIPVNRTFCRFFSGEIIRTRFGSIGRLKLSSFSAPEDATFLEIVLEFVSLISQMPRRGLIVDIRGNPGGFVILTKFYTELLTGEPFDVPTIKLRATALLDRIVNKNFTMLNEPFGEIFAPVRPAMRTARLAGDPYIGSMEFNFDFDRLPQIYDGPYVVLGDGLTYSAGDTFAAMHVDHELAPLVLIGENVGAGGSTVRDYEQLSEGLPDEFAPLPRGVGFATSTFRLMRTGNSAGAILENFGVEPDVVYRPTLRDRLEDDVDLFDFLARIVTGG